MNNIIAIFRRELYGYFHTPVAYVAMIVFLIISGIFSFYLGKFYEVGYAGLESFFIWHPWLYMFIIPAISMRLWAEEKRANTIELLTTLPISTFEAVIGKFLAAWVFIAACLFFTFPTWITVNYLGTPDNAVIALSYLASLVMAGAFLAIGSCMSSLTNNQVIAFILSTTTCFLFIMSGFPLVLDIFKFAYFPQIIIDSIASFSFLTNFNEILQGVLSAGNIIFFTSMIIMWLTLNIAILRKEKL